MFRGVLLNLRCRLSSPTTFSDTVKKSDISFLRTCHLDNCVLNQTLTKTRLLDHSFSSPTGSRCSDVLGIINYRPSSSQQNVKQECRPNGHLECNKDKVDDYAAASKENESTLTTDDTYEDELFRLINVKDIVGDDSEALNKFKLLLLEIEVLRQDGMRVPKFISTESWKELFALQTRSQRRKLLKFLWGKEIKKINEKTKKENNRLTMLERKEEINKDIESNEHIHYGFQGSTIFLRIYDTAINHYDNCRLIQAMLHSENVVIDCGYDQDMSTMENKLCSKQLCFMFAENRLHKEPFNLNFCNFKRDTVLFNAFKRFIPTLDDPGFPLNVTEECYLDLFPKDKLVYLTPHCRTELKEFNSDDIYIVGALVDRVNQAPLSLAKAKKQGIRMAHLPLDRYLDWGIGTKSLTINQVLSILLDARSTKNWNEALKHVPRRKVREPGQPVHDPRWFKQRGTIHQPPNGWKKPWKH